MKTILFLMVLSLSGCRQDDSCSLGIGSITNSTSTNTAVTPEPATFWLLLFGALIIIGIYLYFKYPEFCQKCAQGRWGLMYKGECRCNPNGKMS